MQYAVFIVMIASSIRQFWSFFCYSVFQFIKLIATFSKIDGFTLRKELINYTFPILSNGEKNFLRMKSRIRNNWKSIVLKSIAFSMHILIQNPSLISSDNSL